MHDDGKIFAVLCVRLILSDYFFDCARAKNLVCVCGNVLVTDARRQRGVLRAERGGERVLRERAGAGA